jgi:uncharacterized membrane protein YhaH (DUF805 family)
MDIQTILFSFKGRIGRGTYWLSIVPVVVAVHVITFAPILIVDSIIGTESEEIPVSFLIAGFAAQVIWLAGLWPMLAVGSKRLHDRNKRGWRLLVWWLLPFCLFFGGFGHDFLDDPNTVRSAGYFSTGSIMIFASLPIALWGIVELGILPGTKGPNRFGDDPLPPRA